MLPTHMALSFFSTTTPTIRERCRADAATKLRLRYDPYYHAMSAQSGPNIRLNGRDLIMLASNDYLGLSFHPKVIEAAAATMSSWRKSSPPSSAARPATSTPPAISPVSRASPRLPRRVT